MVSMSLTQPFFQFHILHHLLDSMVNVKIDYFSLLKKQQKTPSALEMRIFSCSLLALYSPCTRPVLVLYSPCARHVLVTYSSCTRVFLAYIIVSRFPSPHAKLSHEIFFICLSVYVLSILPRGFLLFLSIVFSL